MDCCAGILARLFTKFPLFLLFVAILPLPASADVIRVATWNIENLLETSGEGKNPRHKRDYRRLGKYAKLLDADIIALQEIENEGALRRVFDPKLYKFFISTRQAKSRKRTAFAVKQEIPVKRHQDLFSGPERKGTLRHGVDIEITVNGQSVRFLSVHLKALCPEDALTREGKACKDLASQISKFQQWVNQRVSSGTPFVVMGDFNHPMSGRYDSFWSQINDGELNGDKLVRATDGLGSKCWGGRRSGYVDHIIYDIQIEKWFVAGSFGQLVYEEPGRMKKLLSDHCPISIMLNVPLLSSVLQPAGSKHRHQPALSPYYRPFPTPARLSVLLNV